MASDSQSEKDSGDRLDSWKEIAAYLQRDVRSVQRWEKEQGLPVRRHLHRQRGTVYAYTHEIDSWREARDPGKLDEASATAPFALWSAVLLVAGTALVTALAIHLWPTPPPASRVDTETVAVREVESGAPGSELDTFLTMSPDGRLLATAHSISGNLAVVDLSSGVRTQLTSDGSGTEAEYAEHAVFSPNGQSIVYSWHNKNQLYDLRRIDVDNGSSRIVFRNESVAHVDPFAWSSDGKRVLAGTTSTDDVRRLGFVSLEDNTFRDLATVETIPRQLSLSPNDRFVVYDAPSSAEPTKGDIHLLATDGSVHELLVDHAAHDFHPVWTRGGEAVLFLSDRAGSTDVWMQLMNDGEPVSFPERLFAELGAARPLGLTADGSLYFQRQTGMVDVFRVEFDHVESRVIGEPERVSGQVVGRSLSPEWSPDGAELAYVVQLGQAGRPRTRALAIRSEADGTERRLATGLASFLRPRWAPDGWSIAVSGRDAQDQHGWYRIDGETGRVVETIVAGADRRCEWAPDGNALYCRGQNERTKFARLSRYAPGAETDVLFEANTPSEIHSLSVSPDGSMIAFHLFSESHHRESVMVVASSGGDPRELFATSSPGWLAVQDWTNDGASVLFTLRRAPELPSSELWSVEQETGEARSTGLRLKGLRDVRLHPDGRLLAFTAGFFEPSLFVLENFLPSREAP